MKDRSTETNDTPAILATRRWIEDFVVGLNLCPFAALPLRKGQVRFVECPETEFDALMQDFLAEALLLTERSPEEISTTLIVYPNALRNFEDFLDFKTASLEVSEATALAEIIQLADFHPDYVFAGVPADDPANATNRSPYPILHLLRVAEMSKAIDTYPNVADIPQRNIDLLRKMAQDQ